MWEILYLTGIHYVGCSLRRLLCVIVPQALVIHSVLVWGNFTNHKASPSWKKWCSSSRNLTLTRWHFHVLNTNYSLVNSRWSLATHFMDYKDCRGSAGSKVLHLQLRIAIQVQEKDNHIHMSCNVQIHSQLEVPVVKKSFQPPFQNEDTMSPSDFVCNVFSLFMSSLHLPSFNRQGSALLLYCLYIILNKQRPLWNHHLSCIWQKESLHLTGWHDDYASNCEGTVPWFCQIAL